MQEEQSTPKADTTTSSHPDAGLYDPDTNPGGYLPLPIWVCHCDLSFLKIGTACYS
jgi:hypothetical protein